MSPAECSRKSAETIAQREAALRIALVMVRAGRAAASWRRFAPTNRADC